MENKELLAKLQENQSQQDILQKKEEIEKFVIFKLAKKYYALYAEKVKEIVINSEIFYVPFVPKYIRGFINRHGAPYTIFDLNFLLEQKQLEASKFLIINKEDDQLAFIISDVLEIVKLPKKEIDYISSQDFDAPYFIGSFPMFDDRVSIVKLEAVYEKLQSDL